MCVCARARAREREREKERERQTDREKQTEESEMFSGSTINIKRTHTDVVWFFYIKWINIVFFNIFYITQTIVMCKSESARASEREKKRE